MEGLSLFVGVLGNITSVLVFLSPIGTFRRIARHKSTEEFESLPYTTQLLNSTLWTYYGITKPRILIATVDGFGILVEIVYVTIFLMYAPPRTKTKTALFVGIMNVVFPAGAILVSRLVLQGEMRVDAIGLMCACLSILTYGSPLAAMKTVVTTKSVEYMPFFLSFILFINGGIWASYAFLVRDYFIGVPNGTGFILGSAQLVLYAIYRKPKASKNKPRISEEGRLHEQLISSSAHDHENGEAQRLNT